ncbi:hypothetical protein CEXT_553071 [Caerostris extrusa]|uniref:Uncharacterized protein n=1 Tax=Caerostris extrusa TaxID=172846 RepID=A0AAV4XFJ4_CAEEX|nr:hypothetical protein CEXT_553071 [Caerostris extrusa]
MNVDEQAAAMARGLYNHIWANFDLIERGQEIVFKPVHPIDRRILQAVLYYMYTTRTFNQIVVMSHQYSIIHDKMFSMRMCDKVYDTFPPGNIYEKIYYISAFIAELVFFSSMIDPNTKFYKAEALWCRIYESKIRVDLFHRGGLDALAEHSEGLSDRFVRTYVDHSELVDQQLLTPEFKETVRHMTAMSFTFPQEDIVDFEELAETFRKMELASEAEDRQQGAPLGEQEAQESSGESEESEESAEDQSKSEKSSDSDFDEPVRRNKSLKRHYGKSDSPTDELGPPKAAKAKVELEEKEEEEKEEAPQPGPSGGRSTRRRAALKEPKDIPQSKPGKSTDAESSKTKSEKGESAEGSKSLKRGYGKSGKADDDDDDLGPPPASRAKIGLEKRKRLKKLEKQVLMIRTNEYQQ